MNRILMLVFFAVLSFSIATAATAETDQKQETGKPAAAATKPAATKPAATKPEATKPEAVKPTEEMSVLLSMPLFSSLCQDAPIASVDDEIIRLRDLNESLSSLHESNKGESAETASKIDYKTMLDRLLTVDLINMEAEDMELDNLPDVQNVLKKNADVTLRDMLKDRQTKDLVPDEKLVEQYYKAAVKEWKVKSVIFAKEEDAENMAAAIKGGGKFDDLAKKALADKTTKGTDVGEYLPADKLFPQVAAAVAKLKAGEVTPIIKVPEGFTIINVEGTRYPENNAAARKDAEEKALGEKKKSVLSAYYKKIVKNYAVINEKLFKSLNFNSSVAKFAKLLDDKRILVKIKDGKPITVGQYTEAINAKFFHGVTTPIKEKRVNAVKQDVFRDMLYKRLYLTEARRLGIDKTAEYKDELASFKKSVMFGIFVEKVIAPKIKVTEAESKKYYEEHISDFTYPEMLKLYSLGFYNVNDAAKTLKKLQQGDDFQWIRSNASGQIKADEPQALSLNGDVITINGLDQGLRKALTDAKTGDYRLYSDGKFSYVINVRKDIPSRKQDYVEAREVTAKKVYYEKLNQSIKDWAAKLRKAHKVRVYITGISTTKIEQ